MASRLKDSIDKIKFVHCSFRDVEISDSIEIKELTDEYLLLTMKLASKIDFSVRDEIQVSLYCSNGVFEFTSQILKVENNFPYKFLYLKTPTEYKVRQLRNFFRTMMSINTTLTIGFNNGEKDVIKCNSYNLSGNGISLILPPEKDEELIKIVSKSDYEKYVQFIVSIHFEGKNINTKAKFVHRQVVKRLKDVNIFAFKFLTINPADSDFVIKQCFMKQLEEQNKSKREF